MLEAHLEFYVKDKLETTSKYLPLNKKRFYDSIREYVRRISRKYINYKDITVRLVDEYNEVLKIFDINNIIAEDPSFEKELIEETEAIDKKTLNDLYEYAKEKFFNQGHVTIGLCTPDDFRDPENVDQVTKDCYYFDNNLKIRGVCFLAWQDFADDWKDCSHDIKHCESIEECWENYKESVLQSIKNTFLEVKTKDAWKLRFHYIE